MDNNERLKFMREWLKELEYYADEDKQFRKKVECLGWAIKKCKSSVDRKADKEKRYSYW